MRHTDQRGATPRRLLPIQIAILVVRAAVASAQSVPSERPPEPGPQPLNRSQVLHSSSASFTSLKEQSLKGPYQPLTPGQSFSWFIKSTISPQHMAGVGILSAGGTAVNRPGEYGPHWSGFADRFGIGMAGSAVGNGIEVSAGLALREDPRYFRVPEETFKSRLGNVARFTFSARGEDGSLGPAYARYIAIVGGNFLSNTWRVRSEANARDALLRSSEGFGGRMAADAFQEFWPDVKKYVFRKHNRAAQRDLKMRSESRP
jgi:hypothetical protein